MGPLALAFASLYLLSVTTTCVALNAETTNLANCKPEFRCDNPDYFIVLCTHSLAICNVRCIPGTPRVSSNACGAACPKGYFVKPDTTDLDIDKCQLHKRCSQDERVILAGSSWHDTICGRAGDFPRIESLIQTPAVKTLEVLDRLSLRWMTTLPDEEFLEVCKHLSPSTPLEKCARITLNELFSAERSITHQLYYALYALFLYDSAETMYTQVIQPFAAFNSRPKYPSLEILHRDPLEVNVLSDTLVVQTIAMIPLDPRLQFAPREITWWRETVNEQQIISHSMLLTVDGGSVHHQDPRCDLTNKFRWIEPYDAGFLAYAMDISLIIKRPHSSTFPAIQIEFVYYIVQPNGAKKPRGIRKNIPLKYIWKHNRHADCTCENEMDYTDPTGPCSPTCIPYARIIPGLPTTNNDWTLEVSYNHNGLTTQRSRVIYGVTRLNTEKICLVTSRLFTSPHGPRADAPAAPVDVMQCDMVLLEFPVKTVRGPRTRAARYKGFSGERGCVTIQVGSQSPPSIDDEEVCIPTSVNRTLDIIARQGWAAVLGVKIAFQIDGDTVNPSQEELSAVLSWLSATTLAVQTVVVDMKVEYRGYLHFDVVSKVYGSRFELKPGFTSSALSQLMTTGGVIVNSGALYFKEGDNVRMGYRKVSDSITSIVWKHNRDILCDWYQGSP